MSAAKKVSATKKPAAKPLPCPFCGQQPAVAECPFMIYTTIYCISSRCAVTPRTGWFENLAEAIAAWNRRAK